MCSAQEVGCPLVTRQVVAINLTRPLAAPVRAAVVEEARMAAAEQLRASSSPKRGHRGNGSHSGSGSGSPSGGYGGGHGGGVALAALRAVEVTHFCGGPCEEDDVVCCLVPGGRSQGWTVVNAAKLQAKRPGRRAARTRRTRSFSRSESPGKYRYMQKGVLRQTYAFHFCFLF
jgi:hypothetical protein